MQKNVNNLSNGQQQKINLLRALTKDFDVLILDEPSSFLDQKTTKSLLAYLNNLKLNKIIIIISHDSDTIGIADDIINLEIEKKIKKVIFLLRV